MRREEEEEEEIRMKVKGDLEMKEEQDGGDSGEFVGFFVSVSFILMFYNKGIRFFEVWEYFYLVFVRVGYYFN